MEIAIVMGLITLASALLFGSALVGMGTKRITMAAASPDDPRAMCQELAHLFDDGENKCRCGEMRYPTATYPKVKEPEGVE
jgi:hypothetical protein